MLMMRFFVVLSALLLTVLEADEGLSAAPTTKSTAAPPSPTVSPTGSPTTKPTAGPTPKPTAAPTSPTLFPTTKPTAPTPMPTGPTVSPTGSPTAPTKKPTVPPRPKPTVSPTPAPSTSPTTDPTVSPTISPTGSPTVSPTGTPTAPTPKPTHRPTSPPRYWALKAKKAWLVNSDRMFDVAKDRINPSSKVRTECFSGSEAFLSTKVLCDRECMHDQRDVADASGSDTELSIRSCNGPWYCAKSEICEMYQEPLLIEGKVRRSCAIVRSCANHSQCFPNEAQAKELSVLYNNGHLDDYIHEDLKTADSSEFTIRYGGFTVKTTCCVNEDKYRKDIDIPCNAALATKPPLVAAIALTLLYAAHAIFAA